ncbi:hypothetical protein NDU88_008180 [Pleurodeles waltl]|uniref:Uncharacterized protein n=1 Tax=Pleurodeles waltl TaxID=8319 RepID=A0AAV7QMS1_PLEWA|nr:hypothetical protein NDU88_008180 [Pleurodeles waltl]
MPRLRISGASEPGGGPQALHISSLFLRVLVPYPHRLGGLPIYPAGPTVAPHTHAIRRSCWLATSRGCRGVWDTSLVTADYPQRAGQRRQPTFPLTGIPSYSTYNTRSADTERDFHQRVHPAK